MSVYNFRAGLEEWSGDELNHLIRTISGPGRRIRRNFGVAKTIGKGMNSKTYIALNFDLFHFVICAIVFLYIISKREGNSVSICPGFSSSV